MSNSLLIEFLIFNLIIYTAHTKGKAPLIFDSAYCVVILLEVVRASLLKHLGLGVCTTTSLGTGKVVAFEESFEVLSALLLDTNILFLLVTTFVFIKFGILVHYC